MYEYHAECTHVVDGDTFDFDVDLGFRITKNLRVRLKDVDTPEIRSSNEAERKHASEAYGKVLEVLFDEAGQPLRLTIKTDKDKLGIYGRYTASVTLPDGQDLGQILIDADLVKRASYPEEGETDESP
jgi:endonuclease YncB( thermonuclease family)